MSEKLLILFLILVSSTEGQIRAKNRECCKYAEQETSCPTNTSCSIQGSLSSKPIHPKLGQCEIQSDSKRDKTSALECKERSFKSQEENKTLLNQVRVNAYVLNKDQSFGDVEIFGLEILIPYGLPWKKANFRLTNNQGCDEECSPRCVDISRPGEASAQEAQEFLVYDCELGIYHIPNMILRSTSGSTYGLDICLDKACQEYLLSMPESVEDESSIALIETRPLTLDGHLIIHFPKAEDYSNISIIVQSMLDEEDQTQMDAAEVQDDGVFSIFVGMNLKPGTPYKVLARNRNKSDKWVTLATFHTGDRSGWAVGIIFSICLLVALTICSLITWKRYNHIQEKNQVNPTMLLESGRIKPRNVLIISNVDNRHHIDIVLSFSKYLKTHCAVGEVFFALDPNTGITSQAEHDPWKWAQDTAEKISKENGFLLFIAGPPPEMGLAIYKDLPNNQAFVGTGNLQSMAKENRISVLHFPYSDPETVPKILPQHIRNDAYMIPKDTNAFLCQLLEVKMRMLYPCVNYPLVKPRVLPHNMKLYKGGKELIQQIENMTAKVNLFREEEKAKNANNGSLNRAEAPLRSSATPSEVKGLLQTQDNLEIREKKNGNLPNNGGIEIPIEKGVLSLNDQAFEDRDKSINPDLE